MSKYRDLAHKQLDEWIEGKIVSGYWPFGPNDFQLQRTQALLVCIILCFLSQGKLKNTLEAARKEYLTQHPPIKYIFVRGKRYAEHDVLKAIKELGVKSES